MLHSKHAKLENLVPFLDMIQTNGYTATTYSEWLESVNSQTAIEKPVLISCDDLTLVSGGINFLTFRKMKEEFRKRKMKATFGLITQPVVQANGTLEVLREQNQDQWNELVEWIEQGMEIATHTSHHQTLSSSNSTPRSDFRQTDFEEEIVDSALLIEDELAKRNFKYKVRTLITPFGSGYSYSQPVQEIHPQVQKACEKAGVKFVVGIAGGRDPVEINTFTENDGVVYVGRTQPSEDSKGLNPSSTTWRINQWNKDNSNY